MKKRIGSILLCLCMVLTLLPTAALADESGGSTDTPHSHPVCGASSCSCGSSHDNIDKWTATSALPTTAGYYYLTDDVELSSTWTVPATGIYLCLNGHKIICKSETEASVIKVAENNKVNVTFTLTDCGSNGTITHDTDKTGCGVQVGSGGEFDLYGGTITGNDYSNNNSGGGGVSIGSGGKFYMYGGSITGNKADVTTSNSYAYGCGGGVYVNSGGTFEMSGGSISGNTATATASDSSKSSYAYGGGVYVGGTSDNKGNFTMTGGSISSNTATGSDYCCGGGVYVKKYGTFTMNGGTIGGSNDADKNTALYGGGVCVNGGTFNMSGNATISGNSSGSGFGGGVYVYGESNDKKGTFTMTGGTIGGYTDADKNTALYGGGVCVEGGTFTMSDNATISGNSSGSGFGGGVYVQNHPVSRTETIFGSFTMTGGTIGGTDTGTANTACNGGGVYMTGGTFDMSGGSITGNNAKNDSGNAYGGVYVFSGTFTLSGTAAITNNQAKNGGGVYVTGVNTNQYGNFNMNGGTISGNNAESGGGVYVDTQYGTFTMSGGQITGNNANKEGGGVRMSGTFNLSGNVTINNNYKDGTKAEGATAYTGGTTNNVELNENKLITITGALTGGAGSIGVTTATKLENEGDSVQFATGATATSSTNGYSLQLGDKKAFTPDLGTTGYYVSLNKDENALYLNAGVEEHEHSWTYTASGATITATCNGTGDCDSTNNKTLTIVAPALTVYGGEGSAAATFANGANSIGDVTTLPAIQYQKKQADGNYGITASYDAPTDAGEYKASITVNGVTASVTYTIAPKPITANTDNIELTGDMTYTGNEIKPSVTVKDGTTTIPTSEYNVTYSDNTNAGTATVTITDVTGGNYNVSGSTTFTIAAATQTPMITETASLARGGNTLDLSTLVTNAKGDVSFEIASGDAATLNGNILTSNTTKTGEVVIKVSITAKDENDDDTPEYAAYSNENAITVTVTDKTNEALSGGVTQNGCTYGETLADPTYTEPASTTSKTVTYSGTTNAGASYSSTDAPSEAGSYTVTVKCETADTIYTATSEAFTIAPKPVTITGVTATERNYEANNKNVTLSGGILQGVVDGDTVDFTLGKGAMSNADAGESKAVTTSITLTGDAKDNYTLTQPTGITVKINKINPTGYTIPTGLTATYGQTLADVTLGDRNWIWMNDAISVGDASETPKNFKAKFTPGDTTNYNAVEDIDVPVTVNRADLPAANYPTNLTGYKGCALSTVSLANFPGWSWVNGNTVLSTEQSTYAASYTDRTGNYNNVTSQNLAVTVSDKTNVSDSITFADGSLTYTGSALTFENASISGISGGNWTYTYATSTGALSDGKPLAAGTYTVTAKYEDATNIGTKSATLTVNKATPTGAPKYTAITTSGKTLADAALDKNTGWPDGTVQWVNDSGAALSGTTEVAANTAYKWLFTPTDSTNYNTISGTVTLWQKSSSSGGGSSSGGSSGGGSSSGNTVTVPVSSDSASVNVKAEISKGNATVNVSDKQIEQVANDGAGDVTIDVSGLKNVDSATVPSRVVEKTNEVEDTGLTVALPTGSVTLDETALESVTEAANGKDVTISVVSIPTASLSPVVKDLIGMEPTVAAVVDVNITANGRKQSTFNGGKLTVTIPYTPKKGEDTSKLTVWFIKDDGTIENKGGWYDAENKCFVFETDHLSQYLLVNTNELVTFTDVPADAYYAAAVNWASVQGITGGVDDTHFAPNQTCTRAQIVTFLYRWAVANGVDVSVGEDTNILSYNDAFSIPEYAIPAFQWAVGAGILQGNDGNLMPNQTCTRAQAVAFLFRFAQSTGMDVSVGEDTNILSYNDAFNVPEYAVSAFQWAVGAGIVQGNDGNLLPNNTCTRAQIVTFLYRLLGMN